MDLLLTAGLPWPTILYTILIDEIMIITGLIGALVTSSYKVCLPPSCVCVLVRKLKTDHKSTTVGLLRLRLRGLFLGRLDRDMDCPQARRRSRR